MKIRTITSVVAATAATGLVAAPLASADAETQPAPPVTSTSLGSQAELTDGAVVQGWTISDLKPSSDAIPHQVTGTLWEATATDQAIQGSATPIVSNLNARAADGQTYRALFGAATPQGVNPSTLAQGQETTGKVYFDVTGSTPDSVVYNAGGLDRAVWVKPAPSATRSQSPSTSYGSGSYSSETPASVTAPEAATAAEAPEGTAAAPAATGTEVPEGSQGTPLPEGSQGTPLPEGTETAQLPEGATAPEGTPVPAGAPMPAGSQGTPLPPAQGAPVAPPAEGAPLPASTQTAPEGAQGTPLLPEGADQVPTPTTYTPAPTP